MAITKLTKHNNHQMSVHLTKPGSVHFAALRCKQCGVHIQWLSFKDYQKIKEDLDVFFL